MVVTATTLLLKSYAQVHDWASNGYLWGGRTRLSSWLFLLLRCKMSLILPKRLYSITPLSILDAQWDTLSIDFVVELPKSSGHDAVMMVVDAVSKRVHFILMHTMVTVEGAA